MKVKGEDSKHGDGWTRRDLSHHANPLDFLAEEHVRQRHFCALLDTIAVADAPNTGDVKRALEFLKTEFSAHVQDEVAHFFPLLRQCCLADDEIGPVIETVLREHDLTLALLPDLVRILEQHVRDGMACTEVERSQLHEFALHTRRHVVVGNAILLPIARVRLSMNDLAALRQNMLQDI